MSLPPKINPLRKEILDRLESYVEAKGFALETQQTKRLMVASMLSGMAVASDMLRPKQDKGIIIPGVLHHEIVEVAKTLGLQFEE